MDVLLSVSVRSIALAALAALCLWRVKSAAVKHAVWTVVTAGMLLQVLASPRLPPLPLPVLRPVEFVPAPMAVAAVATPPGAPRHAPVSSPAIPVIPAIYLAGVLFFAARLVLAFLYTARLIRRSELLAPGRYRSPDIAVPLTAGSKVLLPWDWPDWNTGKLRAVLAHEEAHVRRRDWAIALIARVNRCVFWFHPLSWWLERELAELAEQACDDAALEAVRDRGQYARTLLDMARAVRTSQGRLLTAAMAKEANVETRINRILDESRRIPKALGRAGWAALIAVGVPLLYVAAAVQLAPAQTLMSVPAPAAPQAPVLIAQADQSPQRAPIAPPAPAAAPAPPTPQPSETPQAQPEPTRLRRPRDGFGGTFGGPIYIPKIYNGHSKTFFFFNYEEFLEDQQIVENYFAAQNSSDTALKVSLDLSAPGFVTFSIPLADAGGQYDIMVQVRDQDGQDVLSNRFTRVTGTKWDVRAPFAPGTYVLKVLVRNSVNARIGTYQSNFEIK